MAPRSCESYSDPPHTAPPCQAGTAFVLKWGWSDGPHTVKRLGKQKAKR